MAKAHNEWTVLEHEAPRRLEENLWRVVGELPKMELKRQMCIARRADGRLVIHSAIALSADEMRELESWGEPAFLIVPNGWHRLDAPAYKARYPQIKVYCPAGARKHVEQVVAVDGSYDDFPNDEMVQIEHLEGVKEREGVMQVHSTAGTTLVFNDALFNQPHLPGFFGLVMRLMGSTGDARVTRIGKLLMVSNKRALRAHLLRLARSDVKRIVPGHGDVIDADAAGVLRGVADSI